MTATPDSEALRQAYLAAANHFYQSEEMLHHWTATTLQARHEMERLYRLLERSESLRPPLKGYPFEA